MKNSPEKYEELGHPFEWIQYANELFASSEILYKEKDNSILTKVNSKGEVILEKSGISRSYFLLIGFSMENLLKAYLISRKPSYLKDGKIDSSISSNHNLFELSRKLKTFVFSTQEIELLKTLTECIPYWSRYPIPKRFENMTKEKVLTEKIRTVFNNLFERMVLDVYKYINREQKIWTDTEFDKKLNES